MASFTADEQGEIANSEETVKASFRAWKPAYNDERDRPI
jgi:hypothetical protein